MTNNVEYDRIVPKQDILSDLEVERCEMRQKNSEKKSIITEYINSFYFEHGMAPTIREIEAGTGIPRPTVARYLSSMKESGEIEYNGGRRRIETERTQKISASGYVSVAVVGSVSCGPLGFAEENIEEYFRLPASFVGEGTFFLLRARGASMRDVGIEDGDMVLVRAQSEAEEGKIVVALVDGEATLKRFYRTDDENIFRLHPENRDYDDIFVQDLKIQGVATNVIKKLD